MLVCEYGGQCGVSEGERDLFLYSLISPSWIETGKQVTIRNAPTEMGRISCTLSFVAGGATLSVDSDFQHAPRYMVFRVPYSVELVSFSSDASETFEKDGLIFFTSDLTRASIKWRARSGVNDGNYQGILEGYRSEFDFIVKDGNYDPARAGKPFLLDDEKDVPSEPLSFELVRRAFLKEYTRRFNKYIADGGEPYPVDPPTLLTAEDRKQQFVAAFER